jgi:hypothetical protein
MPICTGKLHDGLGWFHWVVVIRIQQLTHFTAIRTRTTASLDVISSKKIRHKLVANNKNVNIWLTMKGTNSIPKREQSTSMWTLVRRISKWHDNMMPVNTMAVTQPPRPTQNLELKTEVSKYASQASLFSGFQISKPTVPTDDSSMPGLWNCKN